MSEPSTQNKISQNTKKTNISTPPPPKAKQAKKSGKVDLEIKV